MVYVFFPSFLLLLASNAENPQLSSPITTNASYIKVSAETDPSETLLGPD